MTSDNQQPVDMNNAGKPRRSAKRFTMPAVVLGLLGGHVVFVMTAITLATGDRSFAVVPDYYQKAVAYDNRKALLAESKALGWSVDLSPSKTASTIGERELILRLTDRDGVAVSGANVAISCYHLANASDPVSFELVEALPGQYIGSAKTTREGFWWFEVTAKQGDTLYINEFKQFVWQAEATQ